jgi:signal transduction histidine kinase
VSIVYAVADRLRRFRVSALTVDWVVAVLLTVGAELWIWVGNDAASHRILAAAVAPAIMLPIGVRRLFPTLVGTGVPVLEAVSHTYWNPQFAGYVVAYVCALYALAVWTPALRCAIGASVVVLVDLALAGASEAGLRVTVPFVVVTVVAMVFVRRVVGDRERRLQFAERERDLATREAVVAERTRIAREMHDVIAHHVSMIVVQAGAERSVLDEGAPDPLRTRDVLATVEQSGRSALIEMRRLLGMLRQAEKEPLSPQPGLDDVPALVEQLREAGLPVELQVEGDRCALPDGIDLSAYRIVQEALTNALRHAKGARANVRVRYGADSIELEIADDGAADPSNTPAGGHGLVGMRERVALYGGRFDASRVPGGGFVVKAALPVR